MSPKILCFRIINIFQEIIESSRRRFFVCRTLKVLEHAENALCVSSFQLNDEDNNIILYSSILYGLNDKVFFTDDEREDVISRVRDSIFFDKPEMWNIILTILDAKELEEWMILPRECYLLELSGYKGIFRLWDDAIRSGKPLFCKDFEKESMMDDLKKIVLNEQFLHSSNPYIISVSSRNNRIVKNFIQDFERNGELTQRTFNKIAYISRKMSRH